MKTLRARECYAPITYKERAYFYDVEHATEMDRRFLSHFLGPGVRSVLEVPCGVGRNVLWLAQQGFDVMGVDIEPEMVRSLHRRLSGLNRPVEPLKVEARQGDMRSLNLAKKFDLVIVPIDSFQQLKAQGDIVASLKSLKSCLADDGTLLIDLARFTPEATDPDGRPVFYDPALPDDEAVFEWTRKTRKGEMLTRFRTQRHYKDEMAFDFYYELEGGEVDRYLRTELTFRLYNQPRSFLSLAEKADVEVQDVFGSHSMAPYRSDSARMIFSIR